MVCIMVLWYVYVLCIINETAGGWGEGEGEGEGGGRGGVSVQIHKTAIFHIF